MSAELYQLQKLRFEQKLKELEDAYMINLERLAFKQKII
jgi:hypothetical protein